MQIKYRKMNTKLSIIFISFLLSSLSIIGLPFISELEDGTKNTLSISIGAIFWLGIIVGMLVMISMNKERKSYFNSNKKTGSTFSRIPGIIKFFGNFEAIIADVFLMVGLLLIILSFIFTFLNDYILMFIVSFTILSFYMHCILNGENYRYYKLIKLGEK